MRRMHNCMQTSDDAVIRVGREHFYILNQQQRSLRLIFFEMQNSDGRLTDSCRCSQLKRFELTCNFLYKIKTT